MNSAVLVSALIITVLVSGVGVVYSKHHSRQLFIELQALQLRRDDMEIEWGQLQLEQSTLATEVAVDNIARIRLDMIVPTPDAVVYIRR